MKAVVYEKKGASGALNFRDVEKPVPGDGEVLVRIRAISLNAADYRSIRMGIQPKRGIYGADVSGTVEATGGHTLKFQPGNEVMGDLSSYGFGGLAEYVAVPERALILKPTGISHGDAAAVPMAAMTALLALRDKGGIKQGYKVLICGAGGGVGTFAVQLAKYYGAEVTAVCGAVNMETARLLGANHVLDYAKKDFTIGKQRYAIVLAINGNYSITAYRRALEPGGICVIVGGALSQIAKCFVAGPFLSIGSRKMRILSAKPSIMDLEFLAGLVEAGKIHPVIDRVYPLDRAAEAMRYLACGHARGKVVITVQ